MRPISDTPLAQNFDITLGRIEITVPNVESGSDYGLVRKYYLREHSPGIVSDQPLVFGDSGNLSPNFTITN